MMDAQQDSAIDLLEKNLQRTYFVTPAWLRIDPTWAPLHGNPRFEKLSHSDGAKVA